MALLWIQTLTMSRQLCMTTETTVFALLGVLLPSIVKSKITC